jgi:CBS domain-containing protein
MLTGDRVPMVSKKTTLGEGIAIMNRNSLGALLVVGRGGRLEASSPTAICGAVWPVATI